MKRKHRIINHRNAALLALAFGSSSALAVDGTWNTAQGSGSWTDAGKWLDGPDLDTLGDIPGGVGATADFQVARSANDTNVTLDGDKTIGILKLGFTGSGRKLNLLTGTGGKLILDNGVSNAQVNFRLGAGNSTISAAVDLKSNLLMANVDTSGDKGILFYGGLSSSNGNLTVTNNSSVTGRIKFFSDISDGSGTITYSQTNGWTEFNNANSFTGTTTNVAGIMMFGTSLALQNSALNTTASGVGNNVANGNGLKTKVATLTLGGLTGNKAFASLFNTVVDANNLGYGAVTALTLNPGTGKSETYSGAIEDGAVGMTLTKTSDGIQTLGGTNTYTGDTLVSAGTLFVNGALSSATNDVTVGADGIIGGDGSIAGGLSFASGADFVFSTSMTLDVAGAVTFAGSFGIANLVGLDSSVAVGTYTLISGTVDMTNVINVGSGSAVSLGDGKSAYLESGSLKVVVSAIPEPSAALLGGLGLLALLRRRRS